MPKLKTKKAIRKRFRITKTGKVKMAMAGKSHILTKKSRKRKRQLKKAAFLPTTQARIIKRLLPYG